MPSVLKRRISWNSVEVEVGGGSGEVAGLRAIWFLGGVEPASGPAPSRFDEIIALRPG